MGVVGVSIIFCSAIALNVVATVMAIRAEFGTPLQKALQLMFVWLVPLLGSMVVITVVTSTRSDHKRRRLSDTGDVIGQPGIGPDSRGGHLDGHVNVSGDGGHGGD